jgi:hypothetical protein
MLVEAITAGTLAQVDQNHPAITLVWDYWAEVAARAFAGGSYDPQAEWRAHRKLRGQGQNYLGSRYVLTLLGTRSQALPAHLVRQILGWIWNNPAGIGYLGVPLGHPEVMTIHPWLDSLALLASYPQALDFARPALDWLREQCSSEGRWDFGPWTGKSFNLPLSDNWRKPGNRAIDHTTCVLTVWKKYAWIHIFPGSKSGIIRPMKLSPLPAPSTRKPTWSG